MLNLVSKMQLREANEKDIEEILKLQPQIYRVEKISPNAKEAILSQLKDETCTVLVAEDDSHKVIATGIIYYIQVAIRNQPYALFEGIVVEETARGKGTGTAMLKEMIAIARYKNCYKIIFTSGADRKEAHAFYEKMGFKKWGVEFRMDLS